MDDEEEFWNKSNIQSFSFDEDEKVSITRNITRNEQYKSFKDIPIDRDL